MLQANNIINVYQRPKLTTPPPIGLNEFNKDNWLDFQKYQKLVFTMFNEIVIDKSWDNLTQTAKIILPRKISSVLGIEYDIKGSIGNENINYSRWNDLSLNYCTLVSQKQPYLQFAYGKAYDDGTILEFDINGSDEGFKMNPLLAVGDLIEIEIGYIFTGDDLQVGGKFNDSLPFNPLSYTQSNPNSSEESQWYGNFMPIGVDNNNVKFTKEGKLDESVKSFPGVNVNTDMRKFVFYGYITKLDILQDGNIQILCEDYMYYLKRASVPNKTYHANDTAAVTKYHSKYPYKYTNTKGHSINTMLADMLVEEPYYVDLSGKVTQGNKTSGIQNINTLPRPLVATNQDPLIRPVSDRSIGQYIFNPNINLSRNIDTVIGDISLENATIGGFLEKIKNEYQINSFFKYDFRNNIAYLYTTTFNYKDLNPDVPNDIKGSTYLNPSLSQWHQFTFGAPVETNTFTIQSATDGGYPIIDSQLEWKDNSDTIVGCYVKSIYQVKGGDESGGPVKTKSGKDKKKLSDLTIPVGDVNGTVYTFFYLSSNATYGTQSSDAEIKQLKTNMYNFGQQQLNKVHYTGYYGSFTTFGYPYVEFGDYVKIVDNNFPERNGTYNVKKVIYKASIDTGLTQEVTIDYKIPDFK